MDELDQLLDTAFGATEDPAVQETAPTETVEETSDAPLVDAAEGGGAASSSPGDVTSSEGEPDQGGTPAPAPQVVPLEQHPEWSGLQNILQQQQQVIQRFMDSANEERAKQQLAAMQAQWDEMEPEQAAQARLKWVYEAGQAQTARLQQQLQAVQNQYQQNEIQRQEAAARPQVIQIISERFGLSEADRPVLELFSTPSQMEAYATQVKAQRQAQTAAAREAKASQVNDSRVLAGGTGGGAATAAANQPIESLDELLDALYGPVTTSRN